MKTRTKPTSKKLIWLRDIAIAVVVFMAALTWTSRHLLDADGSVQLNQSNVVSLEGGVESLLSDTKPNLVYFFAPWCQICDLSIENLNYLDQDKLNIVIVALDFQTVQEVEEFVSRNRVDARVLLGTNELKQKYNIQGYPSYYLIDEDFTVVGGSYGYSTALGLKLRELFGFSEA